MCVLCRLKIWKQFCTHGLRQKDMNDLDHVARPKLNFTALNRLFDRSNDPFYEVRNDQIR